MWDLLFPVSLTLCSLLWGYPSFTADTAAGGRDRDWGETPRGKGNSQLWMHCFFPSPCVIVKREGKVVSILIPVNTRLQEPHIFYTLVDSKACDYTVTPSAKLRPSVAMSNQTSLRRRNWCQDAFEHTHRRLLLQPMAAYGILRGFLPLPIRDEMFLFVWLFGFLGGGCCRLIIITS